ncbi:hypothetical protein ACWT_7893 [Actinoplanes sp. SE50]|uniref:hypothetical protein n=1 Tax=unclassified Actinoplanes TaxID=2626549 RepID=UPI00023EDFBA|nr:MULTISPECIES: hypothetical protein [unclassified Actinoplanes]AEV88902.1 hypothetical protein ACPL_8024 [Actinoplanes sp. SE50/110]ATO87308.1 hypothetical protein ACWT_7893 [Actinoplanes sp. SE50]SLM04726.1 uncharacterized protein ACSP50_8034 [Actinoplanes sp. SE50/110]
MRPAILAVIAGSVLLTGAACDSDDAKVSTAGAPTPAAPVTIASPDYSADTAQVCGKLDKVFTGQLDDFGAAIGKMIAYKEAKQADNATKAEKAAADELQSAGEQIRTETAGAQNPELKEAGEESARKFEASAKDHAYLKKIKSTADLDKTLKPQLAEWMSPVAGFCG